MGRLIKDPERYKTCYCKQWLQGMACPYKHKCQFAHGPQELRCRPVSYNRPQLVPLRASRTTPPPSSLPPPPPSSLPPPPPPPSSPTILTDTSPLPLSYSPLILPPPPLSRHELLELFKLLDTSDASDITKMFNALLRI